MRTDGGDIIFYILNILSFILGTIFMLIMKKRDPLINLVRERRKRFILHLFIAGFLLLGFENISNNYI